MNTHDFFRSARVFTVVAVLVFSASCSSKQHFTGHFMNAASGELARIEARLDASLSSPESDPDPLSGRRLAGDGPVCFKDRLNLNEIKRETLAAEKKVSGPSVNQLFNGIDLSKLPAAQGKFLRHSGGAYFPGSGTVDYRGCADAPCAVNRMVGAPDDALNGYLVYHWFLKTGYLLGLAKSIPSIDLTSDTTGDDRSYQFTLDELYVFWRLSHLLSEAHLALPTLQSLHRFRDGIKPADWGEQTCGDAGGGKTSGFVRLTKNCLSLSTRGANADPDLMDFAYLGITHEISHRLDVARSGSAFEWYLSQQWAKGFAPLSGWREISSTVAGETTVVWESGWTQTQNGATSVWSKSGSLDGFVRDYAATSPVEDFADTVAYFRSNPQWTLQKSPRKYEWIANQFHSGRMFDADSRRAHYIKNANLFLGSRLQALVDRCLSAPASTLAAFGREDQQWAAALSLPLQVPGANADAVKTCISAGVQAVIGTKLAEFKLEELEGCIDINSDSEVGIRRESSAGVGPVIQGLIERNVALAPIVKAQKELRSRLAREIDPREAYLKCRATERPEVCYGESVKAAFDRIAIEYVSVLGQEAVVTEWTLYDSAWSFERARVGFAEAWERLTVGVTTDVSEAAQQRWGSCIGTSYPSRTVHPLLGREESDALISVLLVPFSARDQYVDLRFLECLNAGGNQALVDLLMTNIGRVGVSSVSAEAKSYLLEEVLIPAWNGVLQSRVKEEVIETESKNIPIADALARSLATGLAADLTAWVGDQVAQSPLADACRMRALVLASGLGADLDRLDVRFAEFQKLEGRIVAQSCSQALANPAVGVRVRENAKKQRDARKLEWDGVTQDLRARIKASGETLAKSCVSRNPGSRTSSTTKRKRRDCLNGEWRSKVVDPSVLAWLETEAVKKLPFAQGEVGSWVSANEAALKSEVQSYMERL